MRTCSTSTPSIGTSGRSGGRRTSTVRSRSCVLEPVEHRADDPLDRLPFLRDLDGARREPRHVEQVAHQAIEPLRLLVDRLGEVPARGGLERGFGLEERARRAR